MPVHGSAAFKRVWAIQGCSVQRGEHTSLVTSCLRAPGCHTALRGRRERTSAGAASRGGAAGHLQLSQKVFTKVESGLRLLSVRFRRTGSCCRFCCRCCWYCSYGCCCSCKSWCRSSATNNYSVATDTATYVAVAMTAVAVAVSAAAYANSATTARATGPCCTVLGARLRLMPSEY